MAFFADGPSWFPVPKHLQGGRSNEDSPRDCKTHSRYHILQNRKNKTQCMYNVTLRRVRESLLPLKSSITYLCARARTRACVGVGARARGLVDAGACV